MSKIALSVVMPVRDIEHVLSCQLNALSRQELGESWELIVVDDGSVDDTAAVAKGWLGSFERLILVRQARSGGAAAARNLGIEHSAGETIAFCDGDDIVASGWLYALARAARCHSIVAGRIVIADREGRPFAASDPAPNGQLIEPFGFLPFALTANLAVRRSVLAELGGFGAMPDGGEDVDLSWRAQLAGHSIRHEPDAVVTKRLCRPYPMEWSRYLHYGMGDTALYQRFRQFGMPRRSLFAHVTLIARNLRPALRGDSSARYIVTRASGKQVGRLIGSLRYGVWYM
jgi:glycosyltransferase involved in cell wall biosynthesis